MKMWLKSKDKEDVFKKKKDKDTVQEEVVKNKNSYPSKQLTGESLNMKGLRKGRIRNMWLKRQG